MIVLLFLCGAAASGRPSWGRYLAKPDQWFQDDEGKQIIENILSWQDNHGAWPKNTNTDTKSFSGDHEKLKGSFDNEATTGEMRMLARAFRAGGDPRCKAAFIKAIDLILKAQYPSGGWPQYYPPPNKSYHRHITYNDGVMVRLMELLDEIASEPEYAFVDAGRRTAARKAFDAGIECILKCQIIVNGKRTVWCAQHDEINYQPRPGRSYELVSLSGGESVGILRVLMGLEDPSPEVVLAVVSAVHWYESSSIKGIRIVQKEGVPYAVEDPNAPLLWARFYEIDTNRPIFCDRDGIPKYDYNQLGEERSSGYNWLDDWGNEVFKSYQRWQVKWKERVEDAEKAFLVPLSG
jgi:pectate lyase